MNVPDPGACEWEEGCTDRASALVERYDTAPDDPLTVEASGVWRWLCSDHVAFELGF